MLDRIIEDLQKQGECVGEVSFGVMIEVPALAMQLEAVLEHVDFLSIGSNDLAQYLLAVDRDNPRVAGMYDPCHPGVLLGLRSIVKRCNEAKVPCSLCGEIAGDTDMIPLLIGMGFRKFSMSPVFLPQVKLTVRSLKVSACEELWRAACASQHTGEEVRELLRRGQTSELGKLRSDSALSRVDAGSRTLDRGAWTRERRRIASSGVTECEFRARAGVRQPARSVSLHV